MLKKFKYYLSYKSNTVRGETGLKMLNDRRGVSPVITTVIIVAVGITIAIAVALWMTGLVGAFMGYEKVEIRSAFPEPSGNTWVIHLTYLNTGSSPAKIDNVFINNVPYNSWNATLDTNLPWDANIGVEASHTITITSGSIYGGQKLVSGVTIEIKLHSTGGKEYFTSVVLP
jgi:FlaG/FlaF family flagellin (archaellin)